MQSSEFKILVVLAEEMNMRKAAERLFVSQPALSQRLQTIEKSWGSQIFLRSKRGLTITPAGEKILSFVRDVVQKEENVREELVSLDTEVHGTLKLAVASIIGQYWLPKVLKKYVQAYPHVKISLITGWSSEILRHLYEEQGHIGIIRGTTDWKGEKLHLLSDELFLVDTEIENMEEIKNTEKPYIQFRSDSTYYQDIQDWWHSHFKISPKRTIVVDQIETCKQMVMNGIGYSILPGITLTDENKKISKIPLLDSNGKKMERDTWMLGYESAFELTQVRAFVELVNENIKR